MFTSLKEKFDSLKNSNISAKINKLKSISTNNEEYVEIYNEINEKYTNLLNDYALEMDSKFNRIDVLISSKEVKLVKEEMDAVEVSIKDYETKLIELDKEISKITEREDELREVVVPLKERFRTLKASFYEHKEELSVCGKVFEEKVNEVEKTITKLETKLENGYYKESEEIINELKNDIAFYEDHLARMPKIVSFSMQVLPRRLEQAVSKYQRMKEEGYPLFSIKASTIEEKIKSSLDEIRIRFISFNYEDINDSIKEVAYEIENLNEALEREVNAKETFNQYIDTVYETIDALGKRFLKAKRDTNSIKDVFLIKEEKYTELGILEKQIHILNRIKMELDAYIHSATKQPYSILTTKMGELAEFGGEVEEKLNAYQAFIVSLKTDTEYSYEKVNNYSMELTTLYNTMLGLNHKTLS
jgi:septation ring formation regulator EzrA